MVTYRTAKMSVLTYRRLHFFVYSLCDYETICYMVGKKLRCLSKPSQHLPIYPQQFRSYTVLKSMRKSKNRYFYHIFVSLGDAPGGNDAKCCTDGKRIQCLQIVPQNVPIHLQQFPSYSNRKCKRAVFTYRSPHFWFAWRRPSRNISHGRKDNWMLAKRLAACTYLSSIVSELYDA